MPRARIALAAIRAALGEAERTAEEFGRADAELRALPGRPSIYDLRDRTVYLAASGDPAATFAAAREAVDSGLHAAVLAVEPKSVRCLTTSPGWRLCWATIDDSVPSPAALSSFLRDGGPA